MLKQIVKQNGQQTLGIGIGIQAPEFETQNGGDFAQAKFADAAARVAFVYRSCLKGRRPEPEPIVVSAFAEMLAMGADEAVLMADLKRKPPERDRSEHLWQIKKRILESNPANKRSDKSANIGVGPQGFVAAMKAAQKPETE